MAKLRLELDALTVETFDPGPKRRAADGTVLAHSDDADTGPERCEVALIPTTDWKTCQGADCTARTLCHNSCLGDCVDTVVAIGDIRVA